MRKQILQIGLLLFLASGMLPCLAQTDEHPAAGKDFYFTLFNHWQYAPSYLYSPPKQGEADASNGIMQGEADATPTPMVCGLMINAVENADITFSSPVGTGDNSVHMNKGESLITSLQTPSSAILEAFEIHCTGSCFVNVWLQGSAGSAQSAILPTHLLGTDYVLQALNGRAALEQWTTEPMYSQFTVVGTKDGTTVDITAKSDLVCLSPSYMGKTVRANETEIFSVSAGKVLHFRSEKYSNSISGTRVRSSWPIAVFQGNDLNTNPETSTDADYLWEQASPISTWGKEFVIPKSATLRRATYLLTALADNTEVTVKQVGFSPQKVTLQAGETLRREIESTSEEMIVHRVSTSKPACCYIYTTGSSLNQQVGDPAMAEIVPLDKPATEAYWNLMQSSYNTPYNARLIVTTPRGSNILLNNKALNEYPKKSLYSSDFETHEIPISILPGHSLIAKSGSFSAYVLQFGKSADASAFNISLPSQEQKVCADGTLLFREDFGGNSPDDPAVSTTRVSGMSSKYTLSNGNYMGSATYMVTKKGFYNNMQWHLQDDHTYFGDYSRGYFLEIDGTRDNEPFYSTSLDGLCSGTELDFSAYVANITYAGQIPYLLEHYGYAYPRLRFVITDPTTGQQVASYSTGDILPDYTKVWDVNLSESADWQRVSMRFKVPDNVNSVTLSIFNDVTSDGMGNDFALDDIEVRLCIPPIGITGEDSVCMFRSTTLRAQSEYQQTATQIEYRWWHSTDSSQWSVISTGTSPSLTLPKVHAADSGWYKVAMAPTGNIESANCRTESEPVRLHVTPVTACAPTIAIEGDNSVCPSLPTELRAVSAYPTITGEPVECEWWHSTDSLQWTKIPDVTSTTLSLDFVQAADSGWYKVAMATEGNINNPDYRIESEPYRLFVRSFKQCAPPVTIRSPHNVCAERHYRFNVSFDNNGMITEPIVYQWFFTRDLDPDLPPDDQPWTTITTSNGNVLNPDFPNITVQDSGLYRIAIANEDYITDPEYRAMSEPFLLRVSSDCPICTDGRLLLKEDFADAPPATYTYTLDNSCAGTELSVIAGLAQTTLPAGAKLTITLTDATSHEELKRYEADSTELAEWQRVGFNFGVPLGTNSVVVQLSNEHQLNVADIAIYLCAPTVEITAVDTVCREASYNFTTRVHNGNNDRLAFMEPLDYLWMYSADQTTWTTVNYTSDSVWNIPATTDNTGGWYKVAVAEQGNAASPNCRTESEPFRLTIKKCLNPPQATDTIVCDTLMPFTWHDIQWLSTGDSAVMLHYTTGEDSVLMTYVMQNEHCCPNIQYGTSQLTICDTLLPFTWHYRDTSVVFTSVNDEHQVPVPHWRWTDCTDSVYTLTIDTFRCERLWPIIVNKYNWQLMVNHVALRRFFPEQMVRAYQWYKDSAAINDATADEYSEQNELHGIYQLLIWMNDDTYAWSNIITITDTPEPQPVIMHIYNSNGMPVTEQRLTPGIYIYHYQQGDHVWTQKKIIQ